MVNFYSEKACVSERYTDSFARKIYSRGLKKKYDFNGFFTLDFSTFYSRLITPFSNKLKKHLSTIIVITFCP